jgi:NAD(P)-dependent dehydrogenase (short-subunit alcohol dehydrogenase family)
VSPESTIAGGIAVITGAGSGIGAATARALAGRGATVIAVDVDGAAAAAVATEVGGESHEVDVADRSAMEGLAKAVVEAHGPPDILVNNAGVGMTGRFLDTTAADWDWILGVNLHGVINGCAVFGPGMVERGRGHVVNLSSGLGFSPRATEPAYCTTKAAVLALSQCLRADWGPSGVGVSAICPGIIRTPIVTATRYLGVRSDTRTVAQVKKVFSRGHPPELVAKAIIGAVERNRPVVPVGAESYVGWIAHRLLPTRVVDRVARATFSGV